MKFCLFSDLHYKKGMYIPSLKTMEQIIENSKKANVDFILHCGDFCNDYFGSKELIDYAIKNNAIPFLGVYGNHELESQNNTMQVVTPSITNQINEVVWGTESGKIENGDIAYYYFDKENFRIICLDTNYSFNLTSKNWEHNRATWWCPPRENINGYSLGQRQIEWFKSVIDDAIKTNKHCIINSHVPFIDVWRKHDDNSTILNIINNANLSKKNTVIACFSGHYHTNRNTVFDNILFFDVNASINGLWLDGQISEHYDENHTYEFTNYDQSGVPVETKQIPISTTTMSKETWCFEAPLFAIVDISDDLTISISGRETKWLYDVVPKINDDAISPKISSLTFKPN